MLYRKRIYLVAVLLIVIFASVMLVFIINNDKNDGYKGTLVKEVRQEITI